MTDANTTTMRTEGHAQQKRGTQALFGLVNKGCGKVDGDPGRTVKSTVFSRNINEPAGTQQGNQGLFGSKGYAPKWDTLVAAFAGLFALAAPASAATVEWRFDAEVTSLSLYAAPGCSFDPEWHECDGGEHRGPQLGDTGTGWITLDTKADPYRGGFACNVMGMSCHQGGGSQYHDATLDGDNLDVQLISSVWWERLSLKGTTGWYHEISDMAQIGTPDYDIRIDFTNVERVEPDAPEVAPVPLPASAPLLAMPLGLLIFLRRRAGIGGAA